MLSLSPGPPDLGPLVSAHPQLLRARCPGSGSRGCLPRGEAAGKGPLLPPGSSRQGANQTCGMRRLHPGTHPARPPPAKGVGARPLPACRAGLNPLLVPPARQLPGAAPRGEAPPGPLPMLLLCPPHKHCKALLFGVGMWPPAPGRSVGQGFGEGEFSALRHPNGRAVSSAWNWGPPSARAVRALVVANAPEDGGTRRWHPPWGGLG